MADCRREGLFGRAVLRRGIYAIPVKTQYPLGFEIVGVVHGLYVLDPSDGAFPGKRAAAEHGAPRQGYPIEGIDSTVTTQHEIHEECQHSASPMKAGIHAGIDEWFCCW